MSLRAVVALGGNALGNTPSEQIIKIKKAVPHIIKLISQGYELIITHGNGPQVGMINLAFDTSSKINKNAPKIDLPECTAMSQGYIGYHLQNELQEELYKQKIPLKTVTVLTQVEVNKNDSAFLKPSKPIGSYYTLDEIKDLASKDKSFTYVQDAGRGYRRTVPSPSPINIVEKESILDLVNSKFIVIACGGGGIPVIKSNESGYTGINAVIDKDFASAKLAKLVNADYLLILTAVDRVCLNFNTENQTEIEKMTADEAEKYCIDGQFAPGSMLPKVRATIDFVRSGKNKKAVICSLDKVELAVKNQSGTQII